VRGNPAGTLAEHLMLVRYALGQSESLEPMSSLSPALQPLGLARGKAGATYRTSSEAG